jgi:hypothetical protein
MYRFFLEREKNMEDEGESSHVDIPGLPESEQKGKKGKKKSNAKKTLTLQNFLQDQVQLS